MIAAGATRVDTLHFSGPTGFTADRKPIGVLGDRFHLEYHASTCDRHGNCQFASDSLKFSDPFDVTIQEPARPGAAGRGPAAPLLR